MVRSLAFVLAAITLLAVSNAVLAQEAQEPEKARHVRINNGEAAVFPNIRVHPNPTVRQFETAIVTESSGSIVLVAANAMHTLGTHASLGWYYTADGGATWIGGDTLPTHTNSSSSIGDPAVAFDTGGYFFVNGISGTSSFSPIVARSTDTGLSWTQSAIPNPTNNHRNHIAVDINPTSPYVNNVYTVYATVGSSPIRFSRSTNRGQDFSNPVTINGTVGSPVANAPNLAVGPNGELYATWTSNASVRPIGFNKSTDGGLSWGTPTAIRSISDMGNLSKGPNTISGFSTPVMAVDCWSPGPRSGWIYIVYPARNPTKPDIFLIRSTDGGGSWSDPIKVNQDSSGNDHWFPWISVNPANGFLFVVYYDSRNFPANDSAEVYISYSSDGGDTFADILVSDAPFLPAGVGANPVGLPTTYMGSYVGISASGRSFGGGHWVWACWNDNRTGIHQVYTSRIVFSPTSVQELPSEIPTAFAVEQNYPNPFNPSTTIQFSLPRSEFVTLRIFNMLGEEITVLVSNRLSAGTYQAEWEPRVLPSGVYFYRLQAGSFIQTKKLLLLR